MAASIIFSSLHKINIDNLSAELIDPKSIQGDLEAYLRNILEEITKKETKRKFKIKRSTTEFVTALTTTAQAAAERKLTESNFCSNLAARLLEEEIKSDEQMSKRLKLETGHLRRGSFLQFFYSENDVYKYLGVKVEYTSLIDEKDFLRKIGMPEKHKSYKACNVSFDSSLKPSEDVHVYDTNTTIAKYWWDDFLELEERWTNKLNTQRASDAVIKKLDATLKKYPRDLTILRNATIATFSQEGALDYNLFISTTFENYTPKTEGLKQDLPNIIKSLKELPEKKQFDNCFDLVPSEVKYRKRKIKLTDEIEISYDDSMSTLDDKIWASQLEDGKKVVVIHSPMGYEQFTKKPIK